MNMKYLSAPVKDEMSVINQLMRNSIKRPGQVNQDHGQLLTALFPLLDQSAQRCNIFSCTWNSDTSSLSGMYLAGFFRSLRHDIGKSLNKEDLVVLRRSSRTLRSSDQNLLMIPKTHFKTGVALSFRQWTALPLPFTRVIQWTLLGSS
ncbi:hypothetical protein WMY93_033629 [Mugilogobius chulae]|uniref:Uncharacterized protein n=1 Tax=Mugilogobius chulae TaxID=88201 RepID=A0AAW0MRF7_9GOBI